MSVPHARTCSVLVTDIPIQATLEQVQLHLSRAGTIASISNMYRTGGGTGMSLYCHYRFPQNAAHAITHLSGQSFLNGFPRIVQAFPQPPPPGTVPIPMASLLPTSADALHTSTPLPVLHPPSPLPLLQSSPPQLSPVPHVAHTPPPPPAISDQPRAFSIAAPRASFLNDHSQHSFKSFPPTSPQPAPGWAHQPFEAVPVVLASTHTHTHSLTFIVQPHPMPLLQWPTYPLDMCNPHVSPPSWVIPPQRAMELILTPGNLR